MFRVCAPCFLSLEKPITNLEFFTTHTGLTPLSCLEGILFSQSSMPQLDKFTYFTQFFWLCLFFFTFYILVFVSWVLVRALSKFPIYVIHHMLNRNASQAPASSSSSSNSNNNRKDKRKEKEDCLRNLVFQEVDEYLSKYKKQVIAEFPGAHPYIETPSFLNKVAAELIRDAGLMPADTDPKMNLLDSVHKNLLLDFNLVKKEGYINNVIYDCIRCLLKDYR